MGSYNPISHSNQAIHLDIRSAATALRGDVVAGGILVPGPGHGPRDRSLSVQFNDNSPEGFVVNSFAGDDPIECRDYVRDVLGLPGWRPCGRDRVPRPPARPPKPEPTENGNLARAARIWDAALSPVGTIVDTYLDSRGIHLTPDVLRADAIRFHPNCHAGHDLRLPAMVCRYTDAKTGEFRGVHRTFLRTDGAGKAVMPDGGQAKRMLGPVKGAVIRLTPDDEVTTAIGIAEGIETALAVLNLGAAPIWACGSATTLAAFPVLSCIDILTVWADRGAAGETSANTVATTWSEAGREAHIKLPIGDDDFNSAIQGVSDMGSISIDDVTAETITFSSNDAHAAFFTAHRDNQGDAPPNVRTNAPPINTFSAASILAMTFPPIEYVVPHHIAPGLTLLAGRPKLGKSWMVLDIAIAVASGGYCLGDLRCPAGDVLYLALEDNQRRLQSRLSKIRPSGATVDRLEFATEWPTTDNGGADRIADWIASKPCPRLVIVDVLAMIRPRKPGREASYDADYHAVKALQRVASETNVAIIVVHHTRKSQESVDPIEKVSGTLGLSGAADAIAVLDRDGNGSSLCIRGRDVQEIEEAVTFDHPSCRWRILGAVGEVRRSDERAKILTALDVDGEGMSPKEIAAATGFKETNVRKLLEKMVEAGEVEKLKRGWYRLPERDTTDDGDDADPWGDLGGGNRDRLQ